MKRLYSILFCLATCLLTASYVHAQVGSVRLSVELPGNGIQKDSAVYITGTFNDWNPKDSAYCMKRIDSNHYTLEIPCFYHKKYLYKYTLGSWPGIEKAADGKTDIPNRTFVASKKQKIKDQVVRWNIPEPIVPKDTTNLLTQKQMELFKSLNDSVETLKPVVINQLVGLVQKMNNNLLSDQPDEALTKQYNKEFGEIFSSILDSLGPVLKQMMLILTPAQKQLIRESMKNPNAPIDLFNLVGKLAPDSK